MDDNFIFLIAAVILFLAWIFAKKFADSLAAGVAESLFIRERAEIEKSVENVFSTELEKFKSELSMRVAREIEPLKTSLNISENKSGVIFSLEKETLVEFNESLSTWLRSDMGFSIPDNRPAGIEILKSKLLVSNNSYYKTSVCLSKLELIIEDPEVIKAAYYALKTCLSLKHFIDKSYQDIIFNLESKKTFNDTFIKGMSKPGWLTDSFQQEIAKLAGEDNERIEAGQKSYTDDFNKYFEPARDAVGLFIIQAKSFLKR